MHLRATFDVGLTHLARGACVQFSGGEPTRSPMFLDAGAYAHTPGRTEMCVIPYATQTVDGARGSPAMS